jgi:hypothetical protein
MMFQRDDRRSGAPAVERKAEIDPLFAMNGRRGSIHAGLRLAVRVLAYRQQPRLVAICMTVRPWCDLRPMPSVVNEVQLSRPLLALREVDQAVVLWGFPTTIAGAMPSSAANVAISSGA